MEIALKPSSEGLRQRGATAASSHKITQRSTGRWRRRGASQAIPSCSALENTTDHIIKIASQHLANLISLVTVATTVLSPAISVAVFRILP